MINRFDTYRAHPWHGLPIGTDPPRVVDAYIEITPFDAVKYEIDKRTGYLRVDRPQGSSALPPTLYGFVPQTYCADRDPLDICVLSQQRIDRAEIVMPARVVGGIQVLDGGEADDKILAVLDSDTVFDYAKEITHLPVTVVKRIVHYFATYKMDITGEKPNEIEIVGTYGADHAYEVINASIADYRDAAGERRKESDRPAE
ncbi:UNVERIFIED_CONTAM: hypothetical protein GTU68_062755 [Idotea baltica]|nr:hypothetical protein [Idotea baltica]